MNRLRQAFSRDNSGAVAVYVAIGIVVFMGCAALAMDTAHMVSVKRELVKAAEAGALSGARGLWPPDFTVTPFPEPWGITRDPYCANGAAMGLTTATKNRVEGTTLTTGEVTVEVGRWDYAAKVFTPGESVDANGVRVTTSRASVQTILAQVLGQGPRNMSASAVAVMDFATAVGSGTLPIAINKNYTAPGTHLFINFTPDTVDNAGWFTDPPDTASARNIRDYIDNAACPPLSIGDIINLQNGNDASCLQDLKRKLEDNGGTWIVSLPVVATDRFNQDEPIAAFVPFKITHVDPTGSPKGVTGDVMTAAEFASAMPGGGKAGTLAPPKLVQ
jgi:Flp pilus assembly protein TadG